MTNTGELYASYMRKGSYFNRMLDCGHLYNQWVENALHYLPQKILDKHKEKLVFISTAQQDACRVAREYCESREVILLSDRILPKSGAVEDQSEVRYFIYTVLHEVAHTIKKHKSPKFDDLNEEENQVQEGDADKMAFIWFNQHIKEKNNPHLKLLKPEEIKKEQQKNQASMMKLYNCE